jgi:hypothetical protein
LSWLAENLRFLFYFCSKLCVVILFSVVNPKKNVVSQDVYLSFIKYQYKGNQYNSFRMAVWHRRSYEIMTGIFVVITHIHSYVKHPTDVLSFEICFCISLCVSIRVLGHKYKELRGTRLPSLRVALTAKVSQ